MAREQWKSRLGFLMAAIGCAVGLGNIWRFPYIAYKSGGGAFFIPYLTAVFLVGIPLMMLEQGVGQMEQGSPPLSFAKIRRRWEWLGWWAVIFTAFGIACYYNVVLSWCANYLVYSFNLGWGSNPGEFFQKTFLNVSSGPFVFGGFQWPIVAGFLAMWVMTWLILQRGISRGIEVANKFFMPLLFILIVALVVWSLNLPGAGEGIRAYLTPDFSKVSDPEIWRNAFGQVFFSCSLGYGMIINYASYLPKRSNINQDSVIVVLSNSGFEVFAGFAVFATLGFMAMQMGVPVSEVAKSGPGLSFVAYPQAINQLPFGKQAFGILFFLALILAGLTSMLAVMECFISSACDKFGWKRRKVVNITCGVSALLGLVFTTQAGVHWLDIVDNFINQFAVIAVGLLQCILVTRIYGTRRFIDFINGESTVQMGPVWKFGLTIFTPVILLVMLVSGVWENFQKPYGGYSWNAVLILGAGWVSATLIAALIFKQARWKKPIGG